MYRCVIVNVPVCTNAFVRGHVFVGVLSKPPSLFLCVDIVRCGKNCEKYVGSYYAVCWVFVQLDLLLYRLLGLIVQFVGSLHLDLFVEQHVGSLCV